MTKPFDPSAPARGSLQRGLLCLAAAMLLAACGPNYQGATVPLAKELAAAQELADPWAAFLKVADAEDAALRSPACTLREADCGAQPTFSASRDARVKHLGAALASLHPKAIAHLDATRETGAPEYATLMKEHTQRLLKLAETADKEDPPPAALTLLGHMYGSGTLVVMDTRRAVGYLARAWAGGQVQAAGDAAGLFASIRDYRNAYLWTLRCIRECKRPVNADASIMQGKLSADAVKQAQAAASDPSVVELIAHGG